MESEAGAGGEGARELQTRRGARFALPLFLPVFRHGFALTTLRAWEGAPLIEGCIVNAFLLYKERAFRERFAAGYTLREHVGFEGLLCTDSGAFQGFKRPLLLENRKIVAFQDRIGSDIVAPLDVVTPPGDKRRVAEQKLRTTQKRVREALGLVGHGLLAGVQQGGRFLDLRRRSAAELVEMGVPYLALGSLVPFFNRNHDLSFAGQVIREARAEAGGLPLHVYGAGDPVELPFLVALGADIFDSSSYAHFARSGHFMTPYGALDGEAARARAGEFACPCPLCGGAAPAALLGEEASERLALHNLWTICDVVARVRAALAEGRLEAYLAQVLERHRAWFPGSALPASWEALHG